MLTASVCTIGDEILIGQIVDTNSAYIASKLNTIGVKVNHMQSIADDESEIISSLRLAVSKTDIVIVTGGLGPTKDDITKKAIMKMAGSNSLICNDRQLNVIEEICKKRGIELSDLNREQAWVPDNCQVLVNKSGTAPGMMFEIDGCLLFSLPGVPYEMQFLMDGVIEGILEYRKPESIFHKSIITFGIPESSLAKQIEEWENNLPAGVKLAYLPSPLTGVKLRLSMYGSAIENQEKVANELFAALKPILGNAIYGEGDDTLEKVISAYLNEENSTLSAAESCTGGKISSMLTNNEGASRVFTGGVIAYDNRVKVDLLGVPEEIIIKHGAVSEECAAAMAEGVRKILGTTYGIATSGIAGPGGGSEEKPVGTLCLAVSGPGFTRSKRVRLSGDRARNIDRFSSETLNFLRLCLNIELPL